MDKLLNDVARPLVGLTSLAIGADQVFAEAVLRNGGDLIVILPFTGYELTFTNAEDRQRFRLLTERAFSVEVLEPKENEEEAYLAAGKRVVDQSDWMIAVWDGQPAAGRGGTADIVHYALSQGKSVTHMNPNRRTIELIDVAS